MSRNKHRLPTKRERLSESLKKVSCVCKDAIDEAKDAGDAATAEKIENLKQQIYTSFKELRLHIQEEPEDKEEKQNLFM